MATLLHRPASFVRELKRRKVLSAVVAYAIAAAGVMQVTDVVAPRLGLPEHTVNIVILLALAGLPVVCVLAWHYDIVPDSRGRAASPPTVPPGTALLGAFPTGAALLPVPVRPRPGSVAVLPFASLSGEPDNECFADGVTEDVISHLSKIRSLSVIAHTSVLPFKRRELSLRDIGAALGAATLLEGSVRRSGDRVRIAAQLVDAETGHYLWAESYDRLLTDVFAIQTDVALRIAAALEAQLTADERTRIAKEPTHDLDAYQLFLQGRHSRVRYTAPALRESIQYYQRAIALDPGYAAAYANIAMAYEELAEIGALPPEEAYRAARAAAATALALDADLAEAHCIAGQLKAAYEFDWAGAERDFQRALELSPSDADAWDLYGRMCSALGRHEESVEMERRAHELDPLAHRTDYATALLRAGRLDEALAAAESAARSDPGYDRGRATLGWAYLKQGRVEEGLAELEQAVALSPASTSWRAQLAHAYAVSGRTERARTLLAELEELAATQYVSPYHLAYVHTGLGGHDRAMDLLEESLAARAGAIYAVGGSFLFTALHAEPRFRALLRRMNIPA